VVVNHKCLTPEKLKDKTELMGVCIGKHALVYQTFQVYSSPRSAKKSEHESMRSTGASINASVGIKKEAVKQLIDVL
jgi:hypothetical protein